jgi:hypothetical protein
LFFVSKVVFRLQSLGVSVLRQLLIMQTNPSLPRIRPVFATLLMATFCWPLLASTAQANVSPPALTAAVNSGVKDLELPPLDGAKSFLPEATRDLRLVLRISQRRVFLYEGDQVIASYPVAVGKPGWETPVGTFKILHKVKNPLWENPFTGQVIPPGRDNPLGDRLLVFAPMGGKGFVGFHGTTNESLIGQAVSHGCVRMRNNDIRALFEQVQVGVPVIVEK